MNISDSLYQSVLPFLKKIEVARKRYLITRFISIGGVILWLAPFVFAFLTIIPNALGLLPDPTYDFSAPEPIMCSFRGTTIACKVLLFGFGGMIAPWAWIAITIAMYIYYQPIILAQTEIFSRLLKTVSPNLKFKKRIISTEKVFQSGFFHRNKNTKHIYVLSRGTVEGKIEDVQVEFANVNIINNSYMNSLIIYIPIIGTALVIFVLFLNYLKAFFARNKNLHSSGFKGLFFMADFNKKLKGFTMILPDAYEKHFGFLTKSIQELKKNKGELVYLEDPRFEKEFVIYGTDQVEARFILTPSFMERILALKQKFGKNLLLSFSGSTMYLAIADPQGMMEIPLNQNVINPAILEKPYQDLINCTEIIGALKLNQKIW